MVSKLTDKNAAKERIEKLKKTIDHHRYLYHVLDRQEISDEALDTLKKELFDLEQKFPELVTPDSPTQRVAGKPLKQFKKVRHPKPMLSFNDAFDENDMKEWEARFEKISPGAKKHGYYCELKIDGLAIELTYKKGLLETGSTRGDGLIGEDTTQNLKTVEAIPLVLSEKKDMVVRGEVFVTRKDFERINKEQDKAGLKTYANPRNLAAGSIRQLDSKITLSRRLDSYAYSLITDLGQRTHEEEHRILKDLGFKTNPHNKFAKDLTEVQEFRDHWEKHREKLNYEIDGVVVILNDEKSLQKVGVVGKAPRGAIAYKFSPKESETVVEDIIVQVGRTGVLTPVAVLRPVQIGGTTVSRATLHNLDEIKRLGVKIGDTAIVGRAGDVIPDVKKVIKELRTGKEKDFHMPKKCPVCGEPIEKIEGQVAYRCVNRDCPAIKREAIYHFVSRKALNMEGIGPRIIDQLMAAGLIRDSADLFSLKKEDLLNLERFADKSAENVIEAIQSKKKVLLNKFIYSLGIDHVGEETGFVLAKKFKSLKNIGEASLEELQNVPDVGPVVAQSIYHWFQKPYNKNILSKFKKAGVHVVEEETTKESSKFAGKTFVLTGTLESLGRDEAKDKIRELGGDVSGSVSKNTDYVVAGSEPGSKYDQAQKLGVKIINEKEFLNMVK
ncbi:MAG: NAD-dependent DNA ligase LigA [Candidatus Yanofskybacteria bacterium]|nr:NAD-dependent DNA ligase LigA [Candidatus Yanofskybacteria bacterium]